MNTSIRTYVNEGPGMMWKYEAGDKLVAGPVLELPASSDDLALAEDVWTIGNRMGADANGQRWPSTVRSLSMGDVIVIGETAYTAVTVGWEPIETDALVASLAPTAREHPAMAEIRLERAVASQAPRG